MATSKGKTRWLLFWLGMGTWWVLWPGFNHSEVQGGAQVDLPAANEPLPMVFTKLEEFAQFTRQWLQTECEPGNEYCQGQDRDLSGKVTVEDAGLLAGDWLGPQGGADPNYPDECPLAIPLTAGTAYTGSTAWATGSESSSCGFNDIHDVWHTYTAAENGLAVITLFGSLFDTTLAVYDACGGAELACNDDGSQLHSEAALAVTAGTTYYIRVAGYNGAVGPYTILVIPIEQISALQNDSCGNAYPVAKEILYHGVTTNADGSDLSSCGLKDTGDVWHVYTAVEYGAVTISLCSGLTTFDTTLAVYDGCGGTERACNDDAWGTQSELSLSVSAGTSYYIRVAGFNGATGEYGLLIHPVAPAHDQCIHALAITENIPYLGTNKRATGGDITTCATNDGRDVWHRYVPSVSGVTTISLCGTGTNFDTTLAVFDGCEGTELACNDDSCGTVSKITMAVSQGVTYFIRIAGYNNTSGDYKLTITTPAP